MRLNKFIAQATGLSRRAADSAIEAGRILINSRIAVLGDKIDPTDKVTFDNIALTSPETNTTIMINKPPGYVSSRRGQGSKTVYDLLPEKYHNLKPVGRLDKDSSGLLLLSDDGALTNLLTHPRYEKVKIYHVVLNKTLELSDKNKLLSGVVLKDGLSKFIKINNYSNTTYEVSLKEGKNRQLRRTFNNLGYKIEKLHRIKFGPYELGSLKPAGIVVCPNELPGADSA